MALEAFARGDTDAVLADMHVDIEWHQAQGLAHGGVYHGIAEVRRSVFDPLDRDWWDEFVVTPDEFDGSKGEMIARVNGDERSRGSLSDLHWPWERLAEQAARNTLLRPGDLLGSGTVGTGCILELGDGRWLKPGDVVELEVEGIGVLGNVVGERR